MALLECRTADELREHYKAVKARVGRWKLPEPPAPEPIPEPVAINIEITEIPQETMVQVHRNVSEPAVVRHPSIAETIDAVCQRFNISRNDLLSARRTRNVLLPRQIAMYLAKNLTLRSLPHIGRHFGGRDHTTVIHSVNKIAALRLVDWSIDCDCRELESILGGKNEPVV